MTLDIVSVRKFRPEDINYILATWLRGLYYGNEFFRRIDKEGYFGVYHRLLTTLLAKSTTVVKVACLKEDPEVILGYVVFDDAAIHWVHVKKEWRAIGIAKLIIPDTIKVITHLTKVGRSIADKKQYIFKPFLLCMGEL